MQLIGRVRADMQRKADALLPCLRDQHRTDLSQYRVQIEIDRVVRHLAGFDAGVIQNVVDLREQRACRPADRLGHVELLGIELGLAQHIAHADHGIERRAELVAHARKEEAFRLVGLFGLVFGRLQLLDECRCIERQDHEAAKQAIGELGVKRPILGGRNNGRKSGDRDQHGAEEILQAEAKAVSENDPKINRIEQRKRFVAGMNAPGQKSEIRAHRDDAPRHGYARLVEHVRKERERNAEEQRSKQNGFVGNLYAEQRSNAEIDQNKRTDDDAIDDHLVLAIRPILESAFQKADQREVGLRRRCHRVALMQSAPLDSAD